VSEWCHVTESATVDRGQSVSQCVLHSVHLVHLHVRVAQRLTLAAGECHTVSLWLWMTDWHV